ncbi:MAG: glycosyltransferase, partial [Bacteroidota bacterium]
LYRPETNLHTGYLAPAVRWSLEPDFYTEERLYAWEKRLAAIPALQTADVLLCDNYVGALNLRSDAVLMGSYLWADIFLSAFPDHPTIQQFADRSYELLAKHQPPVICVEEIVMPGVRQRARAQGMPWFGQAPKVHRAPDDRKGQIALLAGATSIAQRGTSQLLALLLQSTDLDIRIPDRLMESLNPEGLKRIKPFGFTIADFANCDLVICRPGIGTVTDSIVANTPMLLFSEGNNLEMEHNTQVLENLEVASSIGSTFSPDRVVEEIHRLLETETYTKLHKALAQRPVNGYDRAVEWFNNHL